MKSLVVGGAGFIGAHLVGRLLSEGREVAVLDPSLVSLDWSKELRRNMHYFSGSTSDRKMLAAAVRGAEEVYHLAAVPDLAWCEEHPAEAMEHNALSVADVLQAAVGAGVRRFVYASSWKVYGMRGKLSEEVETHPDTVYGVTKLIGEQVARAYGCQHGLDVSVLRLFNVYGPGASRGVVRAFVEAARAGQILRVFDPHAERDFVHVWAVVDAFLGAEPGTYNVGTGRATSIEDLARMVAWAADVKVEIEEGGPGLRAWADTERARKEFGWSTRVSLEEGLKEMLA